jgi:hypothetical protein
MERASDSTRGWSPSDTVTAVLIAIACAAWLALRS